LTENLELEKLRGEIATVTLEIFDLCKKRFELAREIAAVKMKKGLPIENLEIERNLKRQVLDFCRENDMDDEFCIRLFELLINESKRIQEETIKSNIKTQQL